MADEVVSPIPLEYGHTPRRRRRLARIGLLLLGVIAACAALRTQIPVWKSRWLALRAQDRCLQFHPPTDLVVYSEQGKRVHQSPDYRNYYVSKSLDLDRKIPMYFLTADAFAEFEASPIYQLRSGCGGTLFLGERTTRSGNRRLVAIHVYTGRSMPNFALVTNIIKPATWRANAANNRGSLYDDGTTLSGLQSTRHITFFAGQSDPNDASHFTIEFELEGKREVLDCWLLDPGPIWFNPAATTRVEQIKVARHPK